MSLDSETFSTFSENGFGEPSRGDKSIWPNLSNWKYVLIAQDVSSMQEAVGKPHGKYEVRIKKICKSNSLPLAKEDTHLGPARPQTWDIQTK